MKSEKRIRRISTLVATAIFLSSLHVPVMAREMFIEETGKVTVSGNETMDMSGDTFIENTGEGTESEAETEGLKKETEFKAEGKDLKEEIGFETEEKSAEKIEISISDNEMKLEAESLPIVSSESGMAVVTTNEQFYAAIADESISVIQVNTKLSGLLDEETGEKPLIINRPLTIQGGIQDAVLNMSYHGIILGADVSFKNIRMEFASSLLDVIAANGYQLTLDNVVLDSTAGDDWTISVFCGGITGYELKADIPETGSNGTVIIRGNSTVGNIYAGTLSHVDTMSGVFDGNAKIVIEEGTTGSIGKIYGCGGRESIEEGTGNLIYYGAEHQVTGSVDVILYDSLVSEVEGFHNNIAVNYRGGEYLRTKKVQNISSLNVESGKLQLTAESVFSGLAPKISVTGGELWLDALDDITVDDFAGSGKLVLGEEQTLTINGRASGSTTVYVGGIELDGTAASIPREGYVYIIAVQAAAETFVFQDEYLNPGYVPKFVSDGTGGGSWIAPEEYVTKVTGITMEDFSYDTGNGETAAESIDMPIFVTYSEDTTLKSLDFFELDVKINGEDVTIEVDSDGYVFYITEELFVYTYSAADGCILRLSDETGYAIPREGMYEISITVPAEYTESGIQALTTQATLTVGEKVGEEEEEKISVEKPVAVTGIKWNGKEQNGVIENAGYTLNGDYKATEVGDYTVTAVLNEGYIWADDSVENVELQWSIEKAELEITEAIVEEKIYDGTTDARVTEVNFAGLQMQEQLEIGTDFIAKAAFENAEAGTGKTVQVDVTLKDTEKTKHYVLKESSYEQTGLSIVPKGISGAKVQLAEERFEYSGNKVELDAQDVTVILEEKELQYGTDYEICWPEDMIEVGVKTISIQGKGNYAGTAEVTFEIHEMQNVPEGLWIAGIEENGYIYTGQVIKPEISVYDGRVLLKEKVDYTISYKNNVNANEDVNEENPSSDAPTITITGKGSYSGKITRGFKIIPKDISENIDNVYAKDITAEDILKGYNSRIQKPVSVVYDNGKKLKNNVHYTVKYPSTANDKTVYKDVGEYDIVIRGKGNYTGERIISLTITEQKILGQAVVSKIPNQPYTGSIISIEPEDIIVKYKGVKVAPENYLVECEDKEVGKATLVIKAKEDSGYVGEKRVSFKITGTSISRAAITGVPKSVVYTGEEITAESAGFSDALALTVNGKKVEKQDALGNENYSVIYLRNVNKGTASIIFTGQNGFTGTVKKNFTIKAYNINEKEKLEEKKQISVVMDETVFYAKGGSKPKPVVCFEGIELEEGRDYTLSYQNNTAVTAGSVTTKKPMVIIKGRGNFTGNIGVKFDIVPTNFEDNSVKMELSDRVYQNRKNAYKSVPRLVDENGKVLRAGTDYEKTYTYSYKEDTLLSDGITERKAGEVIREVDIPPTGTTIVVTVTGKGNYTGTLSGEYRIVKQDISKARVSVPAQTYTGKEITPDMDEITVKYGNQELGAEDYKIVGYTNNVKKGTAKMTIKGIGEYGGYKTVNFSIRSKSLFWCLGF